MEFYPDDTIKTVIPGHKVGYLNNIPDTRNNLAINAKVAASSYRKERISTEKIETLPNNPEPDGKSVVVAPENLLMNLKMLLTARMEPVGWHQKTTKLPI